MSDPEDDAREKRRKFRRDQVRKGLHSRATAKHLRTLADSNAPRDPTGARFDRRYADDHDENANGLLTLPTKPEQGTGGELHLLPQDANDLPGLIDTAEAPDLVTARASLERLSLAGDADVLSMAADAAETIGARNSLERMMAHQMAAAHKLAMTFTEKATAFASLANPNFRRDWTACSTEAARMASTAARLMMAYNDAMRALERLRNGGKQTVVVQHVEVRDNAQAVVAGTLERKGLTGGGDGRI